MVNEALEDAVTIEESPIESPAETTVDEPVRTYTPKEVTTVVERERKRAYEKGKREAMTELQEHAVPTPIVQEQPQAAPVQQGLTREEVERITQEQTVKVLHEQIAQAKAQSQMEGLANKILAADTETPGLSQQIASMDFSGTGSLLDAIAYSENPVEILRELHDNPMKFGSLASLNSPGNQHLLKKAVSDLSASITRNKEAAQSVNSINAPINQMKPSLKTGADSKSMSVSDFRRAFRK